MAKRAADREVAALRRVALSMPDAVEAAHHGHPDFRVKGKIFATLFERDGRHWGMVKLSPAQQRELIAHNPRAFASIPGRWGARGATQVQLDAINAATLRRAMVIAWRNVAPERLLAEHHLMTQPTGGPSGAKPRTRAKNSKSSSPAARRRRARPT